jgi:excisionase family DNA binding protein
MTGLSLREAAKEAGLSKSTILRAVKAGRLSAARTEDGGYSIDPAELFRVYPPESRATRRGQPRDRSEGHGAPGHAMMELQIQNAVLEAQLGAAKEALAGERRRAEEIREDRERWHIQAERLALMAPAKSAPSVKPEPVRRRGSILTWLKRSIASGQQAGFQPNASELTA